MLIMQVLATLDCQAPADILHHAYVCLYACFCACIQDPARAKFLVREALEGCMGLGGVRIESNVLITADGR
jgi:hypothetical protein